MESLIPIINKLQDVFATVRSDGIQLPQIVVVGTQSSGKSSVLENIVGRSFLPRGTGIVTRMPLVLQLVQSPQEPGPHRREEDGTLQVEEYGRFLHCKEIYTSFDDIRLEIEMQTERIAGNKQGISEEVISLKIYSPTVVNLTLVDLPGLTKVPVGDQPEDIEFQIRNLVLKYIENPNSVIMAVVPANTDMATNECLKLAKDCDPKGDRTLAVITKLDLMDAGTDATDILRGRVIPVKLGIIGVINRSQKDIISNKEIVEAQKDEAEYLLKNYPALADCNGTSYLTRTLNQILVKHIKNCLPDLKNRVQLLITQEQALLTSYGDSDADKNETLLKIVTQFSSSFVHSITGAASNLREKRLVGGARICFIFHEKFKGEVNEIDPLSELKDEDILMLMRNCSGLSPALFVSESAFEVLVKDQIQLLKEPSIRCSVLVHEEMQQLLERCISETEPLLQRFPVLRDKIMDLVSKLLTERMEIVNDMIHNLISMQLAYINSRHPYFDKEGALNEEQPEEVTDEETSEDESINEFKKDHTMMGKSGFNKCNTKANDKNKKLQSEKKDCVMIKKLLESYFETVRITILDAVPKAVMHYLVNNVKDNVRNNLISTLYKSPDMGYLFQEAEHIEQKRKSSSNTLKALYEARKIITEIKDFYV